MAERLVLGLDLGTHCGYAWTLEDQPRIELSGSWDLRPNRFEGGGMRFVRFKAALDDLLHKENAEEIFVFFEEVAAHKGTAASHIYGGLLAILTAECESRGIPYQGLPVGTIKKHATGKGNANKNDMMARADMRFGKVKNADQADALWVLDLGLKQLPELKHFG